MIMSVKYGDYEAAPGSVQYSVSRETLFNDGDIPYAEEVTFFLRGQILDLGGNALSAAIRDLQKGFADDGKNLIVFMPDGTTHSEHVLIAGNCVGGTHVLSRPSFPTNEGAVYSNRMPWHAIVRGEIPIPSPTALLSWHESLHFSGGGPRYGYLERQRGLPIPIRLREHTVFHVTQSGEAVGYGALPTAPLPIWPAAEVEAPRISIFTPKRRGKGDHLTYTHYRIRWTYRFEAAFPLISPTGLPTLWSFN